MGNKSKQQNILAVNLSPDSINSVESAAINLNLKLVVCSSYDQQLIWAMLRPTRCTCVDLHQMQSTLVYSIARNSALTHCQLAIRNEHIEFFQLVMLRPKQVPVSCQVPLPAPPSSNSSQWCALEKASTEVAPIALLQPLFQPT